MTLATAGNRLVLRYDSNGSFSYNNLRVSANDEKIYELANNIAAMQAEKPSKIVRVLTQHMM